MQWNLRMAAAQRGIWRSSDLRRLLAEAVTEAGVRPFELASGAGHDALIMSRRFPIGMLFIRCAGGVSGSAPTRRTRFLPVRRGRLLDLFEKVDGAPTQQARQLFDRDIGSRSS